MFRGNLSKEQPWWEAEILWCLFRQSQILWKTNCQVKTLFCFLVAFTPKISSSMTCSYICSNICTTIKLSVRSQGSQSPWVVPLTYNKGFAALNLNVWWRGIPFPFVWFFLFVASPFTFLVKDEFYGFSLFTFLFTSQVVMNVWNSNNYTCFLLNFGTPSYLDLYPKTPCSMESRYPVYLFPTYFGLLMNEIL